MSTKFKKYEPLIANAVGIYWQTLKKQSAKQAQGSADRGNRSAVTGGKQMDGFCALIRQVLLDAGLKEAQIHLKKKLELPGYYRPTKNWDMLIVSDDTLLAALEFKSQRGPSFGNNFNNRAEEAIGTATDLWVSHREGAFGKNAQAPWLGWVMLLEDCKGSTEPVAVAEPHYKVFPEFRGASYAKRYEILLRRLVAERLYNGAAFLMATDQSGPEGKYAEPAKDLGMLTLLAGLAGHIGVHLASKE
ncbi:PaeR7I family type II restriction endonuclease [Bdellovibrio sp. HCB117]|uniref:PaeR7I family type II restriction endonuclease n=1 Tax=Bdellovibrio sp. HCB117 TaxID=3394359 RepID=UPI0039B50435